MLKQILQIIQNNSVIYTYGENKQMTPYLFLQRENITIEQTVNLLNRYSNNATTIKELTVNLIKSIKEDSSSHNVIGATLCLINRINEKLGE